MSLDFLRPCDCCIFPLLACCRGQLNLDEEEDNDPTIKQTVKDTNKLFKVLIQKYPDPRPVIRILSSRTPEELKEISELYVDMTRRSLPDVLGLRLKEIDSNFGELAQALAMTSAEYDAIALFYAIEGTGADEDVITEILVGRSNAEIEAIKIAYQKLFSQSLITALEGESSDVFKIQFYKLIIALITIPRPESTRVDDAIVEGDIKRLHEAGEARLGSDKEVFIEILSTRSQSHLRRIVELYSEKTSKKTDFFTVVKSEFSGYFENAVVKLLLSAQHLEMHVAEQFDKALKAGRKGSELLIRLIVRYRDPEALSKIKSSYHARYHRSLTGQVAWKTSGYYERLLLALLTK